MNIDHSRRVFTIKSMDPPAGFNDAGEYVGLFEEMSSSGHNPKVWAIISKHGKNYSYKVAENDSYFLIQDYDPDEPGDTPMSKERCNQLVNSYLNMRIEQERSGAIEEGTGVGYIPV